MTKLEAVSKQFTRAVDRLDEVLKLSKNDIIRDSAIQRFEFTIDLAWKTAKAILEEKKNIVCTSPSDCFREAYRQGFIEYDDRWIELVKMRNQTAHIYKEETADEVYQKLPDALKLFKNLLAVARKETK